MVGSRLPEGFVSLHSLKTDENILHGFIQGMSHVQLSRNVWRGHNNGKWFFVSVYLGMEVFVVQPFLVNTVFQPFRVISFCKFFAHSSSSLRLLETALEFSANKKPLHNHLSKNSYKGRLSSRYHLYLSLWSPLTQTTRGNLPNPFLYFFLYQADSSVPRFKSYLPSLPSQTIFQPVNCPLCRFPRRTPLSHHLFLKNIISTKPVFVKTGNSKIFLIFLLSSYFPCSISVHCVTMSGEK